MLVGMQLNYTRGFIMLALQSAIGGSFIRNDWLKTPHTWLNLTAIIISEVKEAIRRF